MPLVLEQIERPIGLAKRKKVSFCAERELGSNAEKILAILARVVGNASQDSLAIEQGAIEGMGLKRGCFSK